MNHLKSELYFLPILLAGIFILAFFIFKPFLYALTLAIIFATVFRPLYKKILTVTRDRKGFSALLATISVFVVVVAPLTFLGIQILKEATELYSSLTISGGTTDLSRSIGDMIQNLKRLSPVPIEFSVDVNQYLKRSEEHTSELQSQSN